MSIQRRRRTAPSSTTPTSATSMARSAPSFTAITARASAGSTASRRCSAILGPGLIVMVGDNDAGAFGTYTQAGQNYGTALLWTLLLLVPVLYVNQEMVLRLGAVTGVGHARLIFERFGRFWGAFSVIDLFVLNALTIVTEFIGISLALGYLGRAQGLGRRAGRDRHHGGRGTGDFRRFERFALVLVRRQPAARADRVHGRIRRWPQIAQDLARRRSCRGRQAQRRHAADHRDRRHDDRAMATVLPAELCHRQAHHAALHAATSRLDLWLGIGMVVIGARGDDGFRRRGVRAARRSSATSPTPARWRRGLERHAGRVAGVLFALALIDASIIGAAAVSLSTAYAIGDVLSLKHSLHRKPTDAEGFYAVYCGLIAVAAALVLIPGAPLGLLTNAVQTLAGVLLPSATVFLLLLCNDKAVLGPWANTRAAESLHRRRDRRPCHAVDHPHRVGLVPRGDERDRHAVDFWWWNRAGHTDRRVQRGSPQNGGRQEEKIDRPSQSR